MAESCSKPFKRAEDHDGESEDKERSAGNDVHRGCTDAQKDADATEDDIAEHVGDDEEVREPTLVNVNDVLVFADHHSRSACVRACVHSCV